MTIAGLYDCSIGRLFGRLCALQSNDLKIIDHSTVTPAPLTAPSVNAVARTTAQTMQTRSLRHAVVSGKSTLEFRAIQLCFGHKAISFVLRGRRRVSG